MTPEVLCTRTGQVATVALNRPERRNALNDTLLAGLRRVITELAGDAGIRVIVLTGAGNSFSVGADLEHLADSPFSAGDQAEQTADLLANSRTSLLLRETDKVTIAAVDGPCAGAAMGLALAADLRLCTPRAVFKAAFVSAGMSGDFGLAWSLSNLLGDAAARALLLEDPRLTAADALARGLVARVLDEEDFPGAVARYAATLAALPALAVRGIKLNLADARLTFTAALQHEAPRHIASARSADALTAARRFATKTGRTHRSGSGPGKSG
jgi:2-(1,2-epoxy-1,2-dihydrophenyl)acetyl-CoA isomerase